MENQNKMGVRPIFPLLMSMALPAMISMFIQSMYNVVDSIFVAQIGEDALTAVSLAFPIQNFILAVAVGTGVGLNSLISRRLGERRFEEANSAVTHGLLLALFTAVVFIILGLLFMKPFFKLFSDSPTVVQMGCDYTYIITIFCFGQLLHIASEKTLQATGKMVYPMIFQATGAIINIILDPIMIFGWFGFPKLGVQGAAIATVIGQICAMLLSLFILFTKDHEVKVIIKGFQLKGSTIRDIYAVGFPSILMNSLGSVLIMGLNGILIAFSHTAVSLFGIYFKLQSFIFMPVSGLVQGAMPIMGYNFGARNKRRLIKTLKASLLVGSLIMLIGAFIFCVFPKQLLSLFNASATMLEMGIPALRIISICFLFVAFGFIFSTLFQAVGKGFYSLAISVMRQLVIILPIAFILSRIIGITGVWVAFPVAEIVSTIVSIVLYIHLNKTVLCDDQFEHIEVVTFSKV